MPHICILSSSVRTGRMSHRVALFFQQYLKSNHNANVSLLDLKEYNFPVFEERLKNQKNPTAEMLEFANSISSADGILIISPEYNGGMPASLKNVIDFLYDEWYRKPVAISTVSSGAFGGSQVITSLQFLLWKIKAWTVPAMFPVPNVATAFDEEGNPQDPESTHKRASTFIEELLWCIEAKKRMDN